MRYLACPQDLATPLLGRLLTWTLIKGTLLLQLLLLLLIRLTLVAQLAHTCPYDNVLAQWPSMEVAQTRFPGCCAPEFFDCRPAGGGSCIPLHQFHDGHVDCLDGSDESCFPGQIRCGPFCANTTHLGECLRNPYCDPLTPHTTTHMPQIIIPAITQAQATFCPLLRRKLCGLPNTISCKGYGECIFIKWMMDGKRDCLDGSDEDPSYTALFKVLAYVGNPIQPAVIALLGANPVPTQPPFVPMLPISPVVPIQPEVHGGVQPITQRPYYWLRTTTFSLPDTFWIAQSTTKAAQPVKSTGTKEWQGPTTTPSISSSTSTTALENLNTTAAGHKPPQEGWIILPSPPIIGNQPFQNSPTHNKSTISAPGQGNFERPESVPLDSFYPVDMTTQKVVTTPERPVIATEMSEGRNFLASSTRKMFPFVPFMFTFPPTASTTTTLARETTAITPTLGKVKTTTKVQSDVSSTDLQSEWTREPPAPSSVSTPAISSRPDSTAPSVSPTSSSSQAAFQPSDVLVPIMPAALATLPPAVVLPPCVQPVVDCALPIQNSYGGLQWPMGPARPFMPWSHKPDFVRYTTPRNPFPEESGSAVPVYTIQPSPIDTQTQSPLSPEVWVPEQSNNNATTTPTNITVSSGPFVDVESPTSATSQTWTSLSATTAISTGSAASIISPSTTTQTEASMTTTQEMASTSTLSAATSTDSAATSPNTTSSTPTSSPSLSTPIPSIPLEDHYSAAVWPAGVNLEVYNNTDKANKASTKNCTERLKQMARDLAPQPMCECPPGQLRDVGGKCVRADISTFRVRLARFCGTRAYEFETEELEVAVILMKLSAILQLPLCARNVDDVIIVNTECGSNCTLEHLNDKYVQMAASVLPDMDVKISELDRSGCYQFDINDCDEKAECIPQGLRYKCHCLPGTNDTDGTGTQCEGVVISQRCKQIFGVCILVWVMMFLLLCFMIPILTYFWIKYCKGGEFIQRVEKWKEKILGKRSESTQNLGGIGDVESAPTTPAAAALLRRDSLHPKAGTQDTLTVPLPISIKPKATAVVPIEPPKDYFIVENVEEGEGLESDDDQSISSSEYTVPVKGADTTVPVEVHEERPASAQSRAGTPTIWETYQILGAQYSRFSSAKRRKSSTHSLDSLIRQREEEALEQARTPYQPQSSSIREEESSVASSSPKRILSRQQTTTVIGGGNTSTTSVSQMSESVETKLVDERVAVNNILSAAAQKVEQIGSTEVDRVDQQEIPADSTSVYVPTPPATTPANVSVTPSTSTSVMVTSRQVSSTADGIDIDLEPIATVTTPNNRSLSSNRMPPTNSIFTQQRVASTTRSVVKPELQSRQGKTLPLRNRRPPRLRPSQSQSTDSDTNIVVVKAKPQWRRPNASPYTVENQLPPLEPLNRHSHPSTSARREDLTGRLPPLPSGHLVSRSLGGSRRQLSNISEERGNEPSDLDRLPVSISCPTSGRLRRKSVDHLKTSKKLALKDHKNEGVAQSSISSSTEYASSEPDFIAADIDLDLPGPYMIPASSIEEARRYSIDVKGRRRSREEIEVSKRVPANKRMSRRDDFKLPPINQQEPTSKTGTGTLARKIASRRAVGGGTPLSHPIHRQYTLDSLEGAERMMLSVRSHIAHAQDSLEEKVHSGCLIDREPWDSSPVREGEIERIPLDWNVSSRSRHTHTGLVAAQPDGIRRVKSSGDLMAANSARARRSQVRVTFDEQSIEFKERKKSRSLNDFSASYMNNTGERDQEDEEEPNMSRPWAKKEQMEWFEKLKNSLENKSWLDYD